MKISIITVCFNSEETIADTIKSVASQKYTDFEHIVIDGLSNDETISVVDANRHDKLIVSSETDSGIYDAMNKGLARAKGDIIGFLNADDMFADAEVLRRVAHAFMEDPFIEACFGDLIYVTKDNSRVVRYWKSQPYKKGNFARGWSPAHPTFYISQKALSRLGKFDIKYRVAADFEFMLRYLECGGVRSTYIDMVQVRMRLGGVSSQSWSGVMRQNLEILNAFKKNGISYSIFSFVIHKLVSRVWQRIKAYIYLTKFQI